MLVSIFRSNQPVVLVGLLILVPVLFGAAFLQLAAHPELAMPLYELIGSVVKGSALVQGSFSILVIMLIGVQLTILVNDAELMERRTHLPALLFPLLLAAFGPMAPLDPALAGMPFVIPALQRAWTMSNTGKVMGALFDAGMLLGIAALFYLPYAFLVVVIWASISVIRPFQLREYIVPAVGAATLFYICWGVITLVGSGEWHPLLTIVHAHVNDPVIGSVPASQRILLYMVLGGMLPVGILSYARSYQRGIMRLKNIRSSFLAFTAALIILIAFVWFLTGRVPPVMVAVPLTVFSAHALQGTKQAWLGESAVFSLLILALWAQWGW